MAGQFFKATTMPENSNDHKQDIRQFKIIIIDHFEDMVLLAYILLGNSKKADEIVSDLLIELWATGRLNNVSEPIHEFLFTEVRRVCSLVSIK